MKSELMTASKGGVQYTSGLILLQVEENNDVCMQTCNNKIAELQS